MTRIGLLLALTVLTACGQQEAKSYPPQYELNFMRNCQAQPGASDAMCSCMWDSIEAQVPVDDFLAFDRVPLTEQEGHPVRAQMEQFALACHAQLQADPEDPPAP